MQTGQNSTIEQGIAHGRAFRLSAAQRLSWPSLNRHSAAAGPPHGEPLPRRPGRRRAAAPARCLHELFERQAERTPDVVALEQDGAQLSYGELNAQANRLAHHLRTVGVAPDRFVGICARRSPAMVVGMLAALKAGGAYVPLDPAYPVERLNVMLRDCAPVVVLAQADLGAGLDCGGAALLALDAAPAPWADRPADKPDGVAGAAPHHLAYLVYTSGSTGAPKGVMVPHRAIVNEVLALGALHGLAVGRRQLQFVSTAFDVCVEDVFSTLACGATLVLRSEAWLGDAANFWRHCAEQRISGMNLPALFWEQLALDDGAAIPPCVRRVVVGGEAMGKAALRAWFDRPGHRPELYNAYGPSETSVCASVQPCEDRGDAAQPIGRPIDNTSMYLLDQAGRLVAPGVPGEIHIGGIGVARGYLRQPELTRARFLADPFSDQPEARMYRTGDLGRQLEDGSIEFIGRNDQQVKIRGFRIEPGEIEARLRGQPGVREATVLAREDHPGDKRLVAYLVAQPDQAAPDAQLLRAALARVLPVHMLPAAYVTLDALPQTPNGKLDRAALPAPAADAYAQRPYQAPQGATEQALARIWAELLRLPSVGRQDNFFELGGHSLLAVQMLSRLRQRLGVEVALQALFDQPVLRDFAAVAARATASVLPALVPARRPAALPLSFAQQRLWIVAQLGRQASAAYHVPGGLRLSGRLDQAALGAALARIVQRHEVLRLYIGQADGAPCQRFTPQAELPFHVHDLRAAHDQKAAQAHWRRVEAQAPFDLAAGPLIRARLLRTGELEHVLLLTMHHIVADGWSMGVLADELGRLYRAYALEGVSYDVDPLAPLAVQYADYTLWQRQWLGGALQQEQLAYWQRQLAGAPALNGLPTDRPRPPVQDFGGDSVEVRLDAGLGDALRALSRRHGTTLYMTLLAGWAALLARLSGQDELVLGTPVANRRSAELEPLIGFFVNTLALRLELAGDTSVGDWLAQVRRRVLAAQNHQDLPFEQVVEALKPERTPAHHPLFQLMFAWQNAADAAPDLAGLALEALPEQGGRGTQFDLALSLREEADGGITGVLSYATALFERDSVERHLACLQVLLRGMARDDSQQVERIELLSEQQRRQLLVEWNATRPLAAPALCLHQLVELQCARAPDAVAVEQDGRQLSYRELNEQANRLAHHLRTLGVAPDRLVALCALRSPAMVVGMLAVLKAGGAYVPLDPAHPPERLNAILRDSAPVAVLTQGGLCDGLDCGGAVVLALDAAPAPWAAQVAGNPGDIAGAAPQHLAYLVYTSGSTGRPKGVMVPHRAIVNEVLALGELHGLCAGRRQLQFVATAFDVCVEDVFSSLASGATLVLRSEAWLGDAANFWRHCGEQRVSGMNLPALFWEQLALDRYAAIPPCVRRIVVGGEAMGAGALRAWFGREGHRPELFNAYGPSETAVCASVQQCGDRGGAAEPIGRPIANTRMYLLDRHGQLVPPGAAGEIHIGGAGVASGYLNQPELTRERFVADPFCGAPGARMYRTGDIGRWLADGTVEFIGRNDRQVKIRGFRVEPGEIEARLERLPGVGKSAVLAREDRPGEKRLVAYLAAAPGQAAPAVRELRQALSQVLPDYMVPAAYVTVDALPLTPNGKLDRQALPAPAADAYTQHAYQAPQGPVEQALAQIWAELLRAERVGRQDHFFELGGHSLLAVQMTARLRQRLGVEVALQEVFARPVLRDFAAVVAQTAASAMPPLLRGPRPATIPLSFAQQRLWFIAQMGRQASAAYHIPGGLRLRGRLDEAALAAALARIVQRHEVLRTRIELVDGEPSQRILAQAAPPLQRHDIGASSDPAAALAHWRELEARAPFDLAAGPLLRARLLRLAAQEHVLLLTMHHIVSDGWSMGVLADELARLYRAYALEGVPYGDDPLAPLVVQYADYTLWQRQWLGGALQQEQLAYWQRQLAGAPALNALPTDRPRPPVQDFGGDSVDVRLDADLGEALRALSRRHGTTLYMTLLAGWAALLARLSGQDELVIGTPVANRRSAELEPLIGFFVNTLALRLDLAGDPSVGDWLAQVRQRVLEAQSHQDLPFEQVVEVLKPERTLAHHPLFQLMFVWQNAAGAAPAMAGLELAALPEQGGHGTQFDLALSLREEADGRITGVLSYATALFERDSVERYLAYLQVLLRGMARDDSQQVDRVDLLSEQQRRQLLVEWNATRPLAASALCLHQLVELQCARAPDAVAVEQDGRQLSYRELNEQANRLAHHLRTLGVAPDQMVALCARRSPAMVVGMLAVLKAGGAYVPLDPAYPPERLNAILRDSEPVAVLTQGGLCNGLDCGGAVMLALDAAPAPWAAQVAGNPGDIAGVAGAAPHHLAYLVYTSGSTGQPKGVMVPHRAIVNEVLALGELHGLCAGRRQLQFVSTAFDVCAEDVFSTLASGATLVLRSEAWLGDAANFWRHCRAQRVSGMNLPALFWEQLALDRRAAIPPCVRRIVVGGEVMGAGALRSWFGREGHRPELFNAYGPSETAVCASVQQCGDRGGAAEPIGKPIANTRMYLLNRHGQLVPPGVAGEIHIGGAGVARGYLNQPELTRERFVADPFCGAPGARMYRTGDIGRWLADGTVEFIGRNDQQVKIRGFRIEPGEIEVQLSRLPGVGEAVVVPRQDRPGHKYLAAYVVAQPGQSAPAAHDLRQALSHVLPEHMVPAAYVALAALPLTPNGKLDRAALPAPQADAYARHDYQAPQSAAETAVAQIWAELLHVDRVGRLDSFFALGGHSLLAVQMTARLRQRLGVEVALQEVFAEPVLQDFAEVVERAAASALPPLLPAAHPDTIPLSFAQQRLWFVAQMGEQASAAYHIPGGLRLRGRLDEAALATALARIVRRHEALRTRFELVDGEPCQRIA
ncbi:amino acid adenylation domain-containing protein, partial [Rugamonas rubra]